VLPWIAGAWIIGLCLGSQWQPSAGPLFVAAALFGAWPVARYGSDLRSRLWVAPLAMFALSASLGVVRRGAPPCSVRGPVTGTATVESVRYRQSDALLRLRLLDARMAELGASVPEGQRVSGRVDIERAPPPRSTVHFDAELVPRTTLRNPSPHPRLSPTPESCWARWRGPPQLALRESSAWRTLIHGARSRVRDHLRSTLPDDAAAVARALVLGDGAALPYERRQLIASVGLAHLFAVSGLHIALVSGALVALLRWLFAGLAIGFDARRVAAGLGIPLTLLHATFAGGSPSASRAAATAALTWGLVAAGRRPSAPAISAAAALLLSAPDPSMALRPAFLLSIVATSAILSAPPQARGVRWRWLSSAATVSARTLVATAPLVWWWFGGVPLVGWLANIVVLPFGSWVVIPLGHLLAMTAWTPSWAKLPAEVFSLAARALLVACETLAPLAVTQRLPPLDPAQGLIVLVACGLLLALRSWRPRLGIIVAAVAAWLLAEHALVAREQPRGRLRISFVDVGQGDAALIDLPDGALALVDTGQGGRHPASRELRGLLAARRRSRIDVLVITHGHPDHYGGLEELLDEVALGEIWLNGQLLVEERDGAMERLLATALDRGVRLRFSPELCATTHEFGGAEIELLWPCPRYDPLLDLNDNSMTLRLSYGRRSFLLTGDLEAEAERALLAHGLVPSADVLKVAHHGSRTSTTKRFLRAVGPSLAVISSGAGNRYGHPSPIVLGRLRDAGVEILRTDRGGGVIFSTDGASLEMRR
jgi:competence protein ComEC